VHGFGSSTDALWRNGGWIDDLEASGRTVIGVDLPGHGASRDVVDRDVADIVIDVAARHGSADAIGFSAGAWSLLGAAGERPGLFERIAVLGAGDMILTQGLHAAAMQQPMVEILRSSAEPTDNPHATEILAQIEKAGNDRGAVADFLVQDKRFPTLDDLGQITAWTLVVEGGADLAGPSELVRQTIPNSERLTVDGAGHFELPTLAECRSAVTTFINQGG